MRFVSRVMLCLCITLLVTQTSSNAVILKDGENVRFSQNSVDSKPILDQFLSINSTDNTNVISMDVSEYGMVACAEFTGIISNNLLNNSPIESSGSSDILLFGWNESTGYWYTTISGIAKDFCWDVKWGEMNEVIVAGYYSNQLTIGNYELESNGFTDGFVARYNYVNQNWTGVNSIGSEGDKNDVFRSIVPLSNGSYYVLVTSNGEIDLNSSLDYENSISNHPDCSNSGSAHTNDLCTFGMYLNSNFTVTGFSSKIDSEVGIASVLGKDVAEVGSSGEIIIVGRFSGEVNAYNQNGTIFAYSNGVEATWESNGMNDIFVSRYDSNGNFVFISTFGSIATDEATSIASTSGGFVILGTVTSTLENPAIVHEGQDTWQAPPGEGGKDNLLLRISTTGKILDGYTFGTAEDDSVGEVGVDNEGVVYATGYLGSTISDPQNMNSTLGVTDVRSAYLAKIDFSGGNQSSIVNLEVSNGSTNSDARTNSVAVVDKNIVWVGGRMSTGAQENTFYGEDVGGDLSRTGFAIHLASDHDNDSIPHRIDNCPDMYNQNQLDYDNDSEGDICDLDDDNDGISDTLDTLCPQSYPLPFTSNSSTDNDGDGCFDETEDLDDDNDGFSDSSDTQCPRGHTDWTAGNITHDRDEDGCHDQIEDDDDDGDGFLDHLDDRCNSSTSVVYNISTWMDTDIDGCHDSEDDDIDNDGIDNDIDACDSSPSGWTSNILEDYDQDGCRDIDEDNNDDNDPVIDAADQCNPDMGSIRGDLEFPVWEDHDGDGCHTNEDDDDDNDGITDGSDACPEGLIGWNVGSLTDLDSDGCHDAIEDDDDDGDGVFDQDDSCDPDSGYVNSKINWNSNAVSDHDDDGCDEEEDIDEDNDGITDNLDSCVKSPIIVVLSEIDFDNDGCFNSEDSDDDNDGITDYVDNCDDSDINWESTELSDIDGDGCSNEFDLDIDGDGVANDFTDSCPSGLIGWSSNEETDHDGDGCQDSQEDTDDDDDSVYDDLDSCPIGVTGWVSNQNTDYDNDGCKDEGQLNSQYGEDTDDDNDGIEDHIDECSPHSGQPSAKKNWISDSTNDIEPDGCHDKSEDLDQKQAAKEAEKALRVQDDDKKTKEMWTLIGLGVIVSFVIVAIVAKGGIWVWGDGNTANTGILQQGQGHKATGRDMQDNSRGSQMSYAENNNQTQIQIYEQWMKKTKHTLVAEAEDLGINTSGTKSEIVNRLIESGKI